MIKLVFDDHVFWFESEAHLEMSRIETFTRKVHLAHTVLDRKTNQIIKSRYSIEEMFDEAFGTAETSIPKYTADDVKQLRENTGCGLMACKKALNTSQGNMELARNLLFKELV